MASVEFKRKIEDFVCGHCHVLVRGNGYTNHCPHCLWSRHVDIHPGDRAALCGGLMRPMSLELVGGEYIITHHCVDCGYEKRNRAAKDDELEKIISELS